VAGFLLDTHIFLWWLQDNPRLPKAVRKTLADPDAVVFVSAVSIWEIAIKASLRKLTLRNLSPQLLRKLPEASGFTSLPFSAEAAAEVLTLPLHHHDPFDRALIAQAQVDSLVLITEDEQLAAYPIAILKA
jgi:PIN domain nuclease of toxin-antitoxin system